MRRGTLAGRASGMVSNAIRFGRDVTCGTTVRGTAGSLERVMEPIPLSALLPHKEALLALAKLTLEHRFDLLGSGWVTVPPPASLKLNVSNRRAMSALRGSIDNQYCGIDWQCDFKSGHRWSERKWHRHVQCGGRAGVDTKVPWELARMQHLPRLALAYGIHCDARYAAEFRNQILDFAAANPPRFGVNWARPMEVAVRCCNWLVANDLFQSFGATFDSNFQATLTRLVLEHARYVRAHLERRAGLKDHRYLACIAGLMFAARFLPRTPETANWLRFATGELIREVHRQFHSDGGNFEGSTAYHRFSAESVIFATALLAGVPEPPELPAWYRERLSRIAEFTRALQAQHDAVPQIGDNDSGRFLHLTPMYRKLTVHEARTGYVHLRRYESQAGCEAYWDLNDRDHGHLLQAADALLCAEAPKSLEGCAVRSLARQYCGVVTVRQTGLQAIVPAAPMEPKGHAVPVCRLDIGQTRVTCQAFPDFGVYLYRNRDFSLCIRCGGTRGPHAHNDHLSIELCHRGETLFRDPGTFAFAPHPALYRRYRSLAAHAVPFPVEDSASENEASSSQCISFTPEGFLGHGDFGAGRSAYRNVRIQGGILEITDFLNTTAVFEAPETLPCAPGYGKLSSDWVRGGRLRKEQGSPRVAQCF